MVPKKQLSDNDRANIIDAFDNNISKAKLARFYDVDPKTIYNIVNSKREERKKYDN